MSDTDKVAVQYEVDREDVRRIIDINENEWDAVREFLDLCIEIAEAIDHRDGNASGQIIAEYCQIEELSRDISRLEDVNEREIKTKLDLFAVLGFLEKEDRGYSLA